VNGRLVPLSTKLESGDIVEVITSKSLDAGPSRDWLNFVRTSRAKSKIKQWFLKERRDQATVEGRDEVMTLLRKEGLGLGAPNATVDAGRGGHRVQQGRRRRPDGGGGRERRLRPGGGEPGRSGWSTPAGDDEDLLAAGAAPPLLVGGPGIIVEGLDDMLVRIARCCAPVPGDDIVGFVTVGLEGRVGAPRRLHQHGGALRRRRRAHGRRRPGPPERVGSFTIWVQVEALDRTKLLRDVTSDLRHGRQHHGLVVGDRPRDRVAILRYEIELSDPGMVSDGSSPTSAASTGCSPPSETRGDGSELWVTLLGGSGVEVYDPANGERLAVIDLPDAGAVELIFDRAGDRAYASQMETASVYEIDVATRRVLRRLATESSWTKVMALSPDETRLYASNWLGNDVSEIDVRTGEVVRRLRTVTTPRGLYVDPAGRDLYVAGYEDGEIEVIDLETGERRLLHRSGGSMRHLAGDGRGKVYASDMGRARVLVVDVETGGVEMLAPTNRAPNTIALTPDGRVLAVSNRGRNNPESYYLPGPEWGSVILIDTETGRYLDAIVGGNQPTGLAVSADGRYLAYSDFLDDRVTVYELPATEVLLQGDGGRWEAHLGELRK
jgi:DNA-binding beta-propeller fold protein YncE